MKPRIAALAVSLFSIVVVLLSLAALPAQADPSGPGNLATQNVIVTPPVGIPLKPTTPKLAKNKTEHRMPPRKGEISTLALPSGYHYVYGAETPATGQTYFHSNMLVAQPTCSGAGNHSLAELTSQFGNVSGLDRDNIVEFGWACEPNAFGTNTVTLFGSCWVNNVWQASYQGGCGYLDNGANATNLGTAIGGAAGTVKKFALQYTTGCGATSGWWVWYDTAWVGCFPTPGGANRLATTFTAGTFFQAFGETYKAASPGTCLGMGNDIKPITTTTASAYFNTLSHQASGAANASFPAGSLGATDPTVYDKVWLSNTVFRFGGKEAAPC